MLEILAGLTLALLIAIGAAILYWYRTAERLLLETAVGVARAEVLLKGTTKDIAAGNAMLVETTALLAEAIANLPKKGKPGRKPSTSANGTASRRGRPPKATPPAPAAQLSAPSGAESEPASAPAPAVSSGALFPFPSVSNE